MSAIFSPCQQFRYQLRREFVSQPERVRKMALLMLNPSKAGVTDNDPTILSVCRLGMFHGATEVMVGNLGAYISTDPIWIFGAPDPIGPENDHHLRAVVAGAEWAIAAWGRSGGQWAKDRAAEVQAMLGIPLLCFGMNQDGSPKHPLFLPRSTPIVPWTGYRAAGKPPARAGVKS